MKKKWIAIVLLMTGAIVVCVFMSKRASYTSVLETNWRISLPYEANIKAIYEKDSGASFHGDGIRYHIFEYRQEEFVTQMLDWKAVENTTIYHESCSEAADEWLSEISVEEADYPEYDNCLYWYKAQEDNSEIIIFWDKDADLLYVLEYFL